MHLVELRLTFHFRDSAYVGKSIFKNASIFTPTTNENEELKTICKDLSETKINIKGNSENICNLRYGLNSIISAT